MEPHRAATAHKLATTQSGERELEREATQNNTPEIMYAFQMFVRLKRRQGLEAHITLLCQCSVLWRLRTQRRIQRELLVRRQPVVLLIAIQRIET